MYKEDLVLNNQQGLICYKSQPNEPYQKGYIRSRSISESKETIKLTQLPNMFLNIVPGKNSRMLYTVLKPCCGPVKGPKERLELGFTWNKVY